MGKVKVSAFSVSLDGFGAGLHQDVKTPLGVGGFEMMSWFMKTAAFATMHGVGEGTRGVDNEFALRSFENVGAWILGRNMFGPVRGPWENDDWKGWWGDEPPYHVPVFVLTHYPRAPVSMKGGTTFYFVTDGIESALRQARDAAKGREVRIGGGVSTVRQYLRAGEIDEMHLAFSHVLLGEGESLLAGINLPKLGFQVSGITSGEGATHVLLVRT